MGTLSHLEKTAGDVHMNENAGSLFEMFKRVF